MRQVNHLRDDMRKTFTAYALLPVFIISLISFALAFAYWNKNVLERNYESRVLVGEALTSIVTSYMEKASEVADGCDLTSLYSDKQLQAQMYQQLYAHVNVLHAGAEFYILDKDLNFLIANNDKRPDFLNVPRETAWGIFATIRQSPSEPVVTFIDERGDFRHRDLAVAKAISRDGIVEGYIVFVIPGAYLVQAITNQYVQFVISDCYDYAHIATNYIFSNTVMNKISPELRNTAGYFSYEDQRYYMTKESILNGELMVYAITPIGTMVSQYIIAVEILLGVLFILTITVILRVKQEASAKTKVIDQLVEAFAAVKQGNLDTRLNIKTNNEFEIIAESYNTMVSSLTNLMELNQAKARETAISEIKQLESQFHPHFLFNTLENIKFMIKFDSPAAAKMIVALSALLRYSINNRISEVTIEEDLAYTQNYLDIQKMRFGERLTYSFEVDIVANKCIIPKLIFQPVIENAIKYGATGVVPIKIITEIWCENDCLEIVIFNDGVGMDENRLADMQNILLSDVNTTTHTGLYNINRRVKLMYGREYGIELQSDREAGTTVRFVLPVRHRADGGEYAKDFDRGR